MYLKVIIKPSLVFPAQAYHYFVPNDSSFTELFKRESPIFYQDPRIKEVEHNGSFQPLRYMESWQSFKQI